MKLTIVSGCACSVKGGELFERIIDDDYCLTERECVHFMRQICDGKNRTAITSLVACGLSLYHADVMQDCI